MLALVSFQLTELDDLDNWTIGYRPIASNCPNRPNRFSLDLDYVQLSNWIIGHAIGLGPIDCPIKFNVVHDNQIKKNSQIFTTSRCKCYIFCI